MLSLAACTLGFSVGPMKASAPTRASVVSMNSPKSFGLDFGALPASVAMAAATPIVVGVEGNRPGNFAPTPAENPTPVRTGRFMDFVDSRCPIPTGKVTAAQLSAQ